MLPKLRCVKIATEFKLSEYKGELDSSGSTGANGLSTPLETLLTLENIQKNYYYYINGTDAESRP
jgi:hypothetical protein